MPGGRVNTYIPFGAAGLFSLSIPQISYIKKSSHPTFFFFPRFFFSYLPPRPIQSVPTEISISID